MFWAALAMMLGGILWVPFGVFEMIAPFGIASVLAVGLLGLASLPLRPLVYAVGIVPPAVGAAIIGLFGMSWIALGWVTLRRKR